MKDEIINLDGVLKESHKLISTASREANEIIALIGNTGCGKSALVKFLNKDKTLKIIENAQDECIFVDSQETISGVGSESFESKTLLPNVVKDEESGCTIVDCAGFNDTRSSEMDFVASFMNNEYLKMAKRIKIVIVENIDNFKLNLSRDAFVKNLMQISQLLKSNYTFLQTSICVIATKVDSTKSDETEIINVQRFMDELKKFIYEKSGKEADFGDDNCLRALKIISYLEDGRIGIFRRPSKVADEPWELDELKQNLIDLRRLIFEKLQYADNACDKFNITVAPTTYLWINRNLIDESYIALKSSLNPIIGGLKKSVNEKLHNVEGTLKEKISSVIAVGREIVAMLENIKCEEDVISWSRTHAKPEEAEELFFCMNKLKFIYGVVGKNEQKIKDLIVGLNGQRKILIEKTANVVEFHEMVVDFFKETRRHEVLLKKDEILERIDSMNVTNVRTEMPTLCGSIGLNEEITKRALNIKEISASHLDNFKCYSRKSFNDDLSISQQKNICIVRGKYILLSQQQEYLQRNRQQRRQIVLEATQTLFIDCDLTLENTHLVLVAPLIEIVKEKRLIKLLGENGTQHAETKAKSSKNDTPGADGLDGNPGFSSGNCKIIALDVRNPKLLEIHSQGGDGSDGQDGGDGNSISSTIPVFEGYQAENQIFETDEFLRNIRQNYHDVKIEGATKSTYKAGDDLSFFHLRLENHPDPELKPSDGGKGGDAGPSAAAGKVEVRVKNTSAKYQVAVSHQNGKNGNAGKGGLGGEARGMYRTYNCAVLPYQRQQQQEAVNPEAITQVATGISQVAAAGTAALATVPMYQMLAIAANVVAVPVISWIASSLTGSKTVSCWKVQNINEVVQSGECVLSKSRDGADGQSGPDNSDQRYKFTDSLLSSEDIKQDFAAFSAKHGYEDEEDYQQLIQFWTF